MVFLPGCSCGEGVPAVDDAAVAPSDSGPDAHPGRDAGEPDSGDDAALPGAPLSTLVCELEEREPIPNPPQTLVSDFGPPVRLELNDPCPQDAVEVSPDGTRVYYWYAVNLFLDVLVSEGRAVEGTEVRFHDLEDGEWGPARLLDLRRGDPGALPGETRVAPDGSWVVWHAQSETQNYGYLDGLPEGQDFDLDLYEAEMTNSVPEPGTHLGREVNSRYLEGEHWMTADGRTLYFASNRPGGVGGDDIWRIERDAQRVWGEAEVLPEPVNSPARDIQPTLSPDGAWVYFATNRTGWGEIRRVATRPDGGFDQEAEAVIAPNVGEPSFTDDGRLFFVHAEVEQIGKGWRVYDVDIYYVEPQ